MITAHAFDPDITTRARIVAEFAAAVVVVIIIILTAGRAAAVRAPNGGRRVCSVCSVMYNYDVRVHVYGVKL